MLAVLYLLFNEGYSASEGTDVLREGLTSEAIRLTRTLCELMPDVPEAGGLLALMLLHDASSTRVDAAGDLVLLEDQDRTAWDAEAIAEGTAILEAALRQRRPGPYQVQAAIAACHAQATTPEATDWEEIAGLYERLVAMTGSPVVELNRAVAVSMAYGPAAGLELMEALMREGAPSSRTTCCRPPGLNCCAGRDVSTMPWLPIRGALELVTSGWNGAISSAAPARSRGLRRRLTPATRA